MNHRLLVQSAIQLPKSLQIFDVPLQVTSLRDRFEDVLEATYRETIDNLERLSEQ